MGRLLVFIYGLFSYAVGLGGLVWFILFVGGWEFLPMHIDSGIPGSMGTALLVNVGLIALFGLQHSVMARASFKRQWTKIIPKAAERSTYVLITGILMGVICLFWQPLNGYAWKVGNEIGQVVLIAGYFLGWTLVVMASFVINHFELFGLQQVYLNLVKKSEPSPFFTERLFYKVVRHPLQLGVLIGLWSTPTMSSTHLMLSVALSGYIFVGLYFEERDLVTSLGKKYEDYQRRIPMIVPFSKSQPVTHQEDKMA